jgi:hypothetical protein
MRPYWKGYLKLALVSGPPRLLTRDVIIVGAAQPPANSCMSAGVVSTCARRFCTALRLPRSPVLSKRGVAATRRLKARSSNTVRGCAARMIPQGEIAFGQIGNGDRQ